VGRDPGWGDRAVYAATAFVVTAAAPELAYRARWPTRLRGRRLAAYIACNTLLHYALRTWAAPYFRRLGAEAEG
jgi:hypothetical protein